jgi:D-glycero-D-manno-heptose 1,7-bisphosphate phosphatase
MKPAVFLDRDGTLIEERGYLDRMELLSVFPWTADALRLLKRAGYTLVVITNQSAIGRGIIDEAFLDEVHRELSTRLARGGATIDRYYYCPHLADAPLERYRQACRCRKPGPGMIEQACRDMNLDPAQSFMIGDRALDVACGAAAGTRTIHVRTGHGAYEEETLTNVSRRSSERIQAARADLSRRSGVRIQTAKADVILNNLMEASGWILRHSPR